MPKVRDLLCRVHVETALSKRKCHRNRAHAIPGGEVHLAVYDSETGARKNYCAECAEPILAHARDRIEELEGELYE
jgi:hypothetical protein